MLPCLCVRMGPFDRAALMEKPLLPCLECAQSRNDLAYLRLGSSGYRLHPLDGLKKQVGMASRSR